MNIRRFPMQFDRVSLKGTQELKRNDTEEKVEIEPETATKQQVPARKALTASVNDIITLYNEANVQIRPVVISDGTTNKPVDNGDSGYGTPVDTIDNSDSDYGVPNTNGKKATFVKLNNTIEPTPDPDVYNCDSGYGVPNTDGKKATFVKLDNTIEPTPDPDVYNCDSGYGVPNTDGKKATFVKLDNTIEPTPDPDVDNNDSGYGVPSTDSKPTGSIDELRKHRIK